MTNHTETTDLFDSPIARTVDRLQDEGHVAYIYGWTPDGRYALVVHKNGDDTVCTVAHRGIANGVGRWETNGTPDEYLSARFPRRS